METHLHIQRFSLGKLNLYHQKNQHLDIYHEKIQMLIFTIQITSLIAIYHICYLRRFVVASSITRRPRCGRRRHRSRLQNPDGPRRTALGGLETARPLSPCRFATTLVLPHTLAPLTLLCDFPLNSPSVDVLVCGWEQSSPLWSSAASNRPMCSLTSSKSELQTGLKVASDWNGTPFVLCIRQIQRECSSASVTRGLFFLSSSVFFSLSIPQPLLAWSFH